MLATDIAAVCACVRAKSDAGVVVENMVATRLNQQPLGLGADLVMHSLTKSIGGHSDLSGGVLAGSKNQT